jgi:hypothetical protein
MTRAIAGCEDLKPEREPGKGNGSLTKPVFFCWEVVARKVEVLGLDVELDFSSLKRLPRCFGNRQSWGKCLAGVGVTSFVTMLSA